MHPSTVPARVAVGAGAVAGQFDAPVGAPVTVGCELARLEVLGVLGGVFETVGREPEVVEALGDELVVGSGVELPSVEPVGATEQLEIVTVAGVAAAVTVTYCVEVTVSTALQVPATVCVGS